MFVKKFSNICSEYMFAFFDKICYTSNITTAQKSVPARTGTDLYVVYTLFI